MRLFYIWTIETIQNIYVLLFNLWKGVAAPEQRKSVSNKLARVLTQLTQVRIHLSDQSQVLVLSACCDAVNFRLCFTTAVWLEQEYSGLHETK